MYTHNEGETAPGTREEEEEDEDEEEQGPARMQKVRPSS